MIIRKLLLYSKRYCFLYLSLLNTIFECSSNLTLLNYFENTNKPNNERNTPNPLQQI